MTTAPSSIRLAPSTGMKPGWKMALGAMTLATAAMATGLVFAAWKGNGPALLEALSASGLAWCF